MLLKPLKKRVPADAPGYDATGSRLVHVTAGCFGLLSTGPSFRTFSMLACRVPARTGKRTVCGMLTGAACRGSGAITGALLLRPGPLGAR